MKKQFMQEAVNLAVENVRSGRGGPFAALVVRDSRVLARGTNRVTSSDDPTAHAEVVAIREACQVIGDYQLHGCHLYTTCEPCPMCLGAIYWARLAQVFYAATRQDAAAAGFDDAFIYEEIARPVDGRQLPTRRLLDEKAHVPFDAWAAHEGRIEY